MFTERKTFSSSFVSSATSGVETGTTWSQISEYRATARSRQAVGEPADDLRRVAHRVVGAARVDALGREGEAELDAGREARLLEQRDEPLAGGARVGRRLEHDELVALQHAGDRRGGGDQRAEIRLAVARQRRRHRDDDRVAARQLGHAQRREEAVRHRGEPLGRDILDIALPSLQGADLARVDVDPHHVVARLAKGDRERQAHVPESDDSDVHGASLSRVGGRLDCPIG